MNRRAGWILVLLAAAAPTFAWPQVPSFPSEAKRVTVDVVVVDGDGRAVPGLTREDFVIRENGVVQPVQEFEAVFLSEARSVGSPGTELEFAL